jgi:copper chaperone
MRDAAVQQPDLADADSRSAKGIDVVSEILQLTVNGMTCGGCENAVKRTLMQTTGVEAVTASHAESVVGVTFDPKRVTPAVLREKIEGLGYEVIP